MPIIGLAHYDSESRRIVYLPSWKAAHLARSKPEVYGDPAVVAAALAERDVDADWTVSELFSFARLALLRKLCDYYASVNEAWYAIRGAAIHKFMERVDLGEDVVKEKRLAIQVPHPDDAERVLKVSGQLDAYYADTCTLVDYKTTSRIPDQPHEGHVLQVNAYAHLLRQHGCAVKRIYLVYLSFQRCQVVPVQLIPDDEIGEAIQQTAWFLQECFEKRALPPRKDWCNPVAERFFCPFYEFCRDNPDWVQVPEGAVFVGGEMLNAKGV